MLFLYTFFLNSFLALSAFSIGIQNSCQVIVDAGSSGTRLYVYENIQGDFKQIYYHKKGIGISWALEGKKCKRRTCTQKDILKVIDILINKLNQKIGNHCTEGIRSFNVYATAGMRVAEQIKGLNVVHNNYQAIKERIEKKIIGTKRIYSQLQKKDIRVETIAGAEEGIYSWLTINSLKNEEVGVFEVGGASAQLVYPCSKRQKECLRKSTKVIFNKKEYDIFSYSWLGLGREEAFKILNLNQGSPCNTEDDSPRKSVFNEKECIDSILKIFNRKKENSIHITDYLNYKSPYSNKKKRSVKVKIPKNIKFHGVGALAYQDLSTFNERINEICGISSKELERNQNLYPSVECIPKELLISQYFANVYFQTLIKEIPNLNVESNERKINGTKVNWTLGAAICSATNCINRNKLKCRWRKGWSCKK